MGLRFFTVYGPRGRPDMAPFKFVDGVVRSLDRPCGYQIYNMGHGNPVSLRDFIRTVEQCTRRKANIEVMPDQPGDVPRTAANISKASMLLGYQPKVQFSDGIQRLVDWYTSEYASLVR